MQGVALLRQQSSDLASIFLLLNVRYSSLLQSEFKDIKTKFESVAYFSKSEIPKHFTTSGQSKHLVVANWTIPFIVEIRGSISRSYIGSLKSYGISLMLRALWWLKVICLDLELKQSSFLSFTATPIGKGLCVKNLVPEDCAVMTSCRSGDLTTVWSLFQDGKASVNDLTPKNYTPLRYAIESDSVDLVAFLIAQGAKADESFGPFQTSILHAAFAYNKIQHARLLMLRGADINYLNTKGWTPAFSLFGLEAKSQKFMDERAPSEEFYQLLSSSSFEGFNIQDGEGWTCLHRAAAFGTANDIKALLSRGADPHTQTFKVSWLPICCAVQFGNLPTFTELVKCHPSPTVIRDIRQWTLLHIAVNTKRIEIMRLLIEMGANPHSQRFATDHCVPEDLRGVAATPSDIAVRRGPEVLNTYVEAL